MPMDFPLRKIIINIRLLMGLFILTNAGPVLISFDGKDIFIEELLRHALRYYALTKGAQFG
jgi:hypothetical protein